MADNTADRPAKAPEPVVNGELENLNRTQDKTAEDLGEDKGNQNKVAPVLLTQREDTGEKLKGEAFDDINLARTLAKEEAIKVINSSIEIVKQRSIAEQVNALADEVVKSTINIVRSEHQQQIQDKITMSATTGAKPEDSESQRAKSCTDIGDDDVFEDFYMEPIPDPYNKAISYLEKHSILQLFQGLTANVVYTRPSDPLEAMMEQLQLMKNSKESNLSLTSSEQAVENLSA